MIFEFRKERECACKAEGSHGEADHLCDLGQGCSLWQRSEKQKTARVTWMFRIHTLVHSCSVFRAALR